MDVDLNFVLVVFECTKDSKRVSNSDLVVAEPGSDFGLALASLPVVVAIVVQPQDTSHHSRRVVH